MKYIKVDKKNNVIAYLTSDNIHQDEGFIEVTSFPDQAYNWKYINGEFIQQNLVKPINRIITVRRKT